MAKPITLDKIWASAGIQLTPSDVYINTGWTLDIPPYEYFNYAFNKWDNSFKILNEQGVFEWDINTTYNIGSKVFHLGIAMISITDGNSGNVPFTDVPTHIFDAANWKVDDGSAVGTIIMFDGNTPLTIDGTTVTGGQAGTWEDNITMPGWYACVDGNQEYGCPNLLDRFIIGKLGAGAGVKQGANSYSLTAAQLPSHNHTASFAGTALASHAHAFGTLSVSGGAHSHTVNTSDSQNNTGANNRVAQNGVTYYSGKDIAINTGGTHGHTFAGSVAGSSAGTPAGSVTVNAFGSGEAIDNKPANYSLLYVRKCF